MKKIACFIILLLITGCSKEKDVLHCEINNTMDYGSSKQVIEIGGDSPISKIVIKESFTIKEGFKEFYDTFYDSVFNSYSTFDKKDGITLEGNKDNLNFTITLSVDAKNMDENIKKDFLIDVTKKGSEIKSELEKDGYTCH